MHAEMMIRKDGSSPVAALEPRDPSPAELGKRIKLLRVSRGLTLKNLEDRGGISATHVSEIERGKASPTVGALGRIARALGVRPSTLIEPEVLPELTSSAARDRQSQRMAWSGFTLEPLTPPIGDSGSGLYLVDLAGGEAGSRLCRGHGGEEWIMVLTGVVEVRVNERPFVLREGDCLHFQAHRGHLVANLGSTPARMVVGCRPRLEL